jgi:hypothetical protein
MKRREDYYPQIKSGLKSIYKIKTFSRKDYDTLCSDARHFRVEQIVHRDEGNDSGESLWIMKMLLQDQEIFVVYVSPDDLIIRVVLKEHVIRSRVDEPLELKPIKKKRRKRVITEKKDDLVEDLKEIGIDVSVS